MNTTVTPETITPAQATFIKVAEKSFKKAQLLWNFPKAQKWAKWAKANNINPAFPAASAVRNGLQVPESNVEAFAEDFITERLAKFEAECK